MSKIKIFHAANIYPSFIQKIINKYPYLSKFSYKKQMDILFEEGAGWIDNFSYYFNSSVDFELVTSFTNYDVAQLQWSKENNFKHLNKTWRTEVLFAQIQDYKPDILFAHDPYLFRNLIGEIKQKVPSIKIIFGWDGVLKHDLELFKDYTIILSPVKETVNFYKRHHQLSYEFNFGFQPNILNKIKIQEPQYDCTFLGQVNPTGQHSERYDLLCELSKSVHLDLWTPSLGFNDLKRYYYHQLRRLMKCNLNELSQIYKFRKNNHGDVYGPDMFQVISDSKIVFNKHINQVGNYAANIRLFEVTGAGSCLITDYKENLSSYFDLENEIVTYKTSSELVSKVNYLLKNDGIRRKIAKAGQNKTLTSHNYEMRFNPFISYLKKVFGNLS